MEVIIVVSKKQRGVIQDHHGEAWSPSGELWRGDSIVIKWTLKKGLETSICHIMGRFKFLDWEFAIQVCYKFTHFFYAKWNKSLMDKISAIDEAGLHLVSISENHTTTKTNNPLA